MCNKCSNKILNEKIISEEISNNTKKELNLIFKTRKIFNKDYLKLYYPYTYNKLLLYNLNIFDALNVFLKNYELKCKTPNCNNLVNFDHKHHPNLYCEKCNRQKATLEIAKANSEIYWTLFIKQNFNPKDNFSVKIKDTKKIIINY